jgi:fatty acid synthase subunit beta
LKHKVGTNWEYSSNLTGVYLDILHEIATSGTTFKDKNALLTGVGKGSIGVEVVKGLLSGGAHVVITTSSYSRKTVEYYQSIFQSFGGRGSALTVVPFNQASEQDVEALVNYIYANLGMDLDYILPFSGIPKNGREIDGLDDRSELAHCMMLVNLLCILGAVGVGRVVAEGPELVARSDSEGEELWYWVRTSYEHEHLSTKGHVISPKVMGVMGQTQHSNVHQAL